MGIHIRLVAVLGLLVCSPAAWSQFSCQVSCSPGPPPTISESPSYDGSYTVSHIPLGCYYEWDPYGFMMWYCRSLVEEADGVVTGEWNGQGSTSINFSGKPEATYMYYLKTEFCLCESTGEYGFIYSGPSYVQVNLPDPIVNIGAVPSGPANQPNGYTVSWSSSYATSCDLRRDWFRVGYQQPNYSLPNPGVPTAGQVWFPRQYSPFITDISHGWVYVTCHGTGGTNEVGRFLDFDSSIAP